MPPSRPRLSRVAFAVALGLGWFPLADASPPGPINWRGDLHRARSDAAAHDRLVWVQFTGPWCHNCHRMEREAFQDARVLGAAARDFVVVKLRSDHHEELALNFGLSCLPAAVILRPDGGVVATSQGYLDPDGFAAFLDAALAREGRRKPPEPAPLAPPRVALGGYCPVSLVGEHRLVAGRPGLTAVHDGRAYRFATEAARAAFLKHPEPYVPVNGGRCPVAQVDRGESSPGAPSWGVLYEGHLYLCGDEAGRKRFLASPGRYAHVDVADRGFCPHCLARDGLLVRGRPAYSLTRGGRRFLFPDATHLDAYRTRDETSRR